MTPCEPINRIRKLFALCLAAASVPYTACAQVDWNGSIGVTSNYVQQGLSQTRGGAALQGGLRLEIDTNWTLGTWVSQVDRNAFVGHTEIDLYAARAWRITPEWVAVVTATHYFYPQDTHYLRYDYDEISAAIGYRSNVFATVSWPPNTSDVTATDVAVEKSALSYEITANQPISRRWSGYYGIGFRDVSELFGESYWYGHAGVMYTARDFSVHLTYALADHTARRTFGEERAADTLMGAVIWRFGQSN